MVAVGLLGLGLECTSPRERLLERARDVREELTLDPLRVSATTERSVSFRFSVRRAGVLLTNGRVRMPRRVGRHPAALLHVGIETGSSVVELIDERYPVVIAALDYPELSGEAGSGVRAGLAYRELGRTTTAALLLVLEMLFGHPNVRAGDVSVVAVSFGAFTAVPVATMDARVRRLVVVQAGGDLSLVLGANARRLQIPRYLVPVGAVLLRELDPNEHIAFLHPRPLLFVSAARDEFFPQRSLASFYARAREPKERLSFGDGHLMPDQRSQIEKLTRLAAEHLYGKMR